MCNVPSQKPVCGAQCKQRDSHHSFLFLPSESDMNMVFNISGYEEVSWMKNWNHLPLCLDCSRGKKSILTIAFKVALNWRGPATDWPLRAQCLAVLVWSPGMQQYARNDECRLFRFASKLVFLPPSYTFFGAKYLQVYSVPNRDTWGNTFKPEKILLSHFRNANLTSYICCHQCSPLFIYFSRAISAFSFHLLCFDVHEKLQTISTNYT